MNSQTEEHSLKTTLYRPNHEERIPKLKEFVILNNEGSHGDKVGKGAKCDSEIGDGAVGGDDKEVFVKQEFLWKKFDGEL